MDITIYQINMGRDHNRIAFEGLDLLKMYQGSDKIDSRIYDRVFEGEVDCKDLEDVYRKFNLEHPEGYKGRSLSVSDVVEIVDENGDSTFHFCDSIGFKQIDFDPYLTEEYKEDKIKVVLCEPGKVARVAEISNTLADLQKTVKGDIEQFCPYEEAVAIICNEEGKFNGMTPNRAIYSEPQEVEMSYGELTSRFREAERNGGEHLTGYIVFTEDSFTKPYPEAARTYAVSSNNKAFQPNMGGYSIYASALDGSDPMIRLEGYMQSEKGGKDDEEGFVAFVAHYSANNQQCEHRERSYFKKIDGEWRFIDGTIETNAPYRRESPKVGRNDPCPCGSGKKYKKCCGKDK